MTIHINSSNKACFNVYLCKPKTDEIARIILNKTFFIVLVCSISMKLSVLIRQIKVIVMLQGKLFQLS